jgi:hypothetical protein
MDEYLNFKDTRNALILGVEEMKDAGLKLAYAENNYRKHLTKKILNLRSEGVAWTACHDIAKGSEEVSDHLLNRDIQEVLYNSAQEKVNTLKIEVRIQENELKNTNY